MLFNEPKLLKCDLEVRVHPPGQRFSALQRAEIAEISTTARVSIRMCSSFSALQRAEIAEMLSQHIILFYFYSFSALQRAEIAEIARIRRWRRLGGRVSVLFNEPKLLKFLMFLPTSVRPSRFQCSSTSRNC